MHAALFGERPVIEAVIASLDGEPVGYALFFPTFSTFLGKPGLYLEDLYVRPAARGLGVGRKLLEHLARLTVERGWGRLEWSVLDWNEPSIAFYKKMGARPMDEWTVFRLDRRRARFAGIGRSEDWKIGRLEHSRLEVSQSANLQSANAVSSRSSRRQRPHLRHRTRPPVRA